MSSSSSNQRKQDRSAGGRRGARHSAGRAVAVAVSAALGGMMTQSAQAKGGIKVEKVARGQARFETRGPNTQITAGDRTIINYRQFDVARGDSVQFVQPSSNSRVLNRINSAEPSHIDGRMSANGIVYFVNPSGVMFGRDAVVNVGKLYAAAANISDGDFVAGINRFVGGVGSVVNQGSIHADAVTLVGQRVINQGEILSQTAITMVAGDDVLVGERDGNLFVKVDTVKGLSSPTANTASGKGPALRMGAGDLFSAAVYNEGKIRAKQITAQTGAGGATVISGTLDASSSKAGEAGGTVKVLGDKVAIAGATIDASGPAGGGTVLVGGDFQGKGAVPTASRTVVTADSTIKADAMQNGAGGKVVVWADGATSFAGKISARGGAAGGDGGNVEVSGKQTLNFTGAVDTTAPAGKTGSLLLDPDSIEIVAGAAGTGGDDVNIDASGLLDDKKAAAASVISAGTLEALGLGAHLSLTATTEIKSALPLLDLKLDGTGSVTMAAGQIHLHDTTISTHGAPVTLTSVTALDVGGITTNAGAAVTGGAVTLTLSGAGTLSAGPITTAGTTAGGKVTVTASSASPDVGAISLGNINAGAGATAGDVTIASAAGGVTLQQITGKTIDISAAGDILAGATPGTIAGTSVKLVSSNGSIGDPSTPTPISVDSTTGVIAEAKNDVAITDPTGTMTLDHVTAGGTASVTAAGGDLLTSSGTTVKAGVKATVTSAGKIGTDASTPLVVDARQATLGAAADLHVKLPQLATGATVKSGADAAGGLYTVGVEGTAGQKYDLTYAKANDLTLVVPGALAGDATTLPVIAANVLTLDAADIGSASSHLLIDATELKALASAGGVAITDAKDLKTRLITATSGNVAVDVTKGDLTITDDISGSAVSLRAGHDIVNGVAGKRVTGSSVSLDSGTDSAEADGKIGTVASPIQTTATTLSLKSHRGSDEVNSGVNASDTDAVELTANAGGKVNVTTVGSGDLVVNTVTGGSVALKATAGSVLAKTSTSTVTATGTAKPPAKLVDIVASKDVGQLDDPANPTAGGLLNIDAVGGLVSISGTSVYLSNVATGQPGNIELTAATPPATVGFDRDGVQSYALNVTSDLTLETKGWIRDTAGQKLSLGQTVDLRSQTDGIGQAGKPILTAAKAIRAAAHGGGGVYVTDDNGGATLEVKNITTQGGAVQVVSAHGGLNLTGAVNAGSVGTSDVLLQAAKDFVGATGHHVTGDDVTLVAGTDGTGKIGASAAPADAIKVDANTLTLRSAGGGGINVDETGTGALSLLEATTGVGGNGAVTVRTKGDLTVTHVATSKTDSAAVVTLTSTAGAIKDGGDAFADVVGNKVTLAAQSGIGSGNALELGAQIIGGAGNETQTTTGGIALNNDASGLIPPLPVGTSTQLWLKAGSGDVTFKQTGGVALTVNRATTADNVLIDNAGAIALAGDVTAGTDKNADVTAGREVTRTAGTVTARHVALTAGKNAGGGDFAIGTPTQRVITRAKELVLKSSDAGDIYVTNSEPGQVSLTASTDVSGTVGTGNIVVSTDGAGGLSVLQVVTSQTAGAGKGRVSLQASAGTITDASGGSTSISAKDLSLDATAIGAGTANPLDTNVLTLAGTTGAAGTGAITIRNTAASLTVGAVPGVDDVTPVTVVGLKTTDSTIDLTQLHGALTLEQRVDAGAAQVFLRAVETGTGTLVNKAPITGTPKPPAPGKEIDGVTLIADNMQLAAGPGAKVQAGTANIALKPASDGRPIVLGPSADAGDKLYLGNAEFATLNTTTGRVEVGSDNAGSIVFTGPANGPLTVPGDDNTTPIILRNAGTLSLVTGGSVTQTQATPTSFEDDKLSIRAGTGVGTAGQRLNVKVGQLAATSDEGGVRMLNRRDLDVTDVGNVSGVRSGKLADVTATIDGDVDILSTDTLTITQMINATGSVHLKADNTLPANSVIVNNQVVAGAGPNAHPDASLTIEANRDIVINKNVAALKDVTMTTATGDVNVHEFVKAETGKVTIDAHDAVLSDLAGDIQADKSVAITSHTGGIDLNKTVTAAREGITLTAGDSGLGNPNNDIHTGKDAHLSAGGAVALTAQDAINTAGRIDAGAPGGSGAAGDVKMTAVAGGVLIENAVTASKGGGITVDAKQDLRTRKDATAGIDSPLTADGSVTLTSSSGNVTTEARVQAGTTSTVGDITARALAPARNVTESGSWSATGSALADAGGDVSFGAAVDAKGSITGHGGGSVHSELAGSLHAGSSVALTGVAGDVSLKAAVTADGSSITASGHTGVTTAGTAPLHAADAVTLTSELGGIATHASVKADGTDITATAHLDVQADGAWSAKRDILAKADANVTSTDKGSMLAGRHVELTAGLGADLGANVTSGAQPPATSTPTDGHIEVVANAGNIVTQAPAALDARSHVLLDATGDVWTKGDVSAGQRAPGTGIAATVTATAGGNVTTDGIVKAKDEVSLTAGGNVDVNKSTTSDDKSITAKANTGNVATAGPLSAQTFIQLDAKQNVAIKNSATASDKSITATATTGNVSSNALGDLIAGTFVDLTAGRDVSLLGTVTAKTDHVQITAGTLAPLTGSITTSDAIAAGTFVHMTAPDNVSIFAPVTARGNDVSVLAQKGNILTGPAGAVSAETFVDLEAPLGKIDLNAAVTANKQYIMGTAGGSITTAAAAPLKAGTSVLLLSKSASVVTHGSVTATGVDIRANAAADVQVDAPWSAGNDVLATAGNDVASTTAGTISAGHAIALDAGRDVLLRAAGTANADAITATAGNDVTTLATGVLTAGTSITLDAGHDVTLAGNATARNQFIKATANNDVTTTTGQLAGHTFVDLQAGADVTLDASAAATTDYLKAHALGGNITTGVNGPLAAGSYADLQALNGHIDLSAPVTANGQYVQALAKGDITTAKSAPVQANTFVLLDSSAGSVITHGTVTAKGGDLTANAAVNVTVDAPWSAGNDVLATAGNDVASTTLGTITGNRRVILLAGNDVTLGAAASATSDYLKATATGGDIITGLGGSASAGSFVDFQALNGRIDLSAPVTARGQYVQALAKRDITTAKSAPVLANSYVLLDSSAGSVITHGTVTAKSSDLTAKAAVDVTVDAPWSAGNDVLATAGHDVASTTLGTIAGNRRVILLAGNDVTLDAAASASSDYLKATATAGDITTGLAGAVSAGSYVDLQALAGAITLAAPVTAKGDYVQAMARRDITSALTAPIQAASHVLLDSSAGSIVTHGTVTARGSDITAAAADDVLADAAWSAGHDILGTAGHDVTSTPRGTMTAARNIDLTASNDITLQGATTAQTGHILGTAGYDILTSGQLTADTEVTLDAGHSITSGTNRVTAGSDITYHAHTGDIATFAGALLSAGNDVLLAADHGKIDLRDDVTAHRDVSAVAQNDITTYPGAPLTATTHNITLTTGGNILTQDLVKAGADLDATAKGDVTLTGGWQSGGNTTADAGGDINVRSTAAYGAAGLFNAGNDVAFTSTGALVKGGGAGDTKVIAGNNIGMAAGSFIDGGAAQVTGQAGHDIQLALVKTTYPGANPDASAAAVTLLAGTKGGGTITDLHTFSEGSGAVGTPSVVAAGLDATAPNDINLGTQLAWVRARSQNSGALTLHEVDGIHVVEATTGSGLLTIKSGDTMLVRDVVAGSANAELRAYHNDLVIEPTPGHQGSVTAAGHKVTLTAADSIVGNTNWRNVKSTDLDATAGAAITLGTDVDNITSGTGGKTILHDFGTVTLTKVTTSTGDVDATADETLNVNTVIAGSGGGKNVHLQAVKGDIQQDGTGINVQSDRVEAEAGGGIDLKTRVATIHSSSNTNTTFDEQDAVTLELVKSDHGDINVTSGGAMSVQEVNGPATSGAHQITLTSREGGITGVGGNSNVVGDHLTTDAKTSILLTTDVETLTSKSGGDATFHEVTSVGIDQIDSGGKVTLTANNGDITDPDGAAGLDVIAKELDVTARTVELDTNVDRLQATGLGGDVTLRELNSVDVNRLTFGRHNLGNLSLSVGRGGVMTMNVPAVRTRGGNQTYTGAMVLAGTAGTFTLSGNNVRLDASVKGGTGYDLVLESTGMTTVHRDVSIGGSISFLGDAKVEFDPGSRARGDKSTMTTVASGVGSSGGGAVSFGKNVTLNGMTQILSNGGSVHVAGDLGGTSGSGASATITTAGGNVDFDGGVGGTLGNDQSGTLALVVDTRRTPIQAGDGTFTLDPYGYARFGNQVKAAELTVDAGDIYVLQGITTAGGITLRPDNRMVKLATNPTNPKLGEPAFFTAPKGILTLHGDLKAGGDITLGSKRQLLTEAQVPKVSTAPDADQTVPNVATIVADGDITITAAKKFEMGQYEKMTVLGSVTITADTMVLSDISALGRMDVTALGRGDGSVAPISFANRSKSLLLTNTGSVGGKADHGLDFFANDGMTFKGLPDPSRLPVDAVTFGVGPNAVAEVGGFRYLRAPEASTREKFTWLNTLSPIVVQPASRGSQSFILDATANGASSTDISVTITQALPQETPKPTEDTNLSSATLARLQDMGIYARESSPQEMVDRVSGRVVYLDVPPNGIAPKPSDYTVVAGKLPQEVTENLIRFDDKLVDVDSDDAKKAKVAKEVQAALSEAKKKFTESREEGEPFDPVAFRAFLAQGDYPQADKVLGTFYDVLRQVERMGLTEKQWSVYRRKLVEHIRPRSFGVDEMFQVIKANPEDRKLGLASPVQGR